MGKGEKVEGSRSLILFLLFSVAVYGQTFEHDSLYQQIAHSQLVIIGSIVNVESPTFEKTPAKDIPCSEPTKVSADGTLTGYFCKQMAEVDTGKLYTIQVEQSLYGASPQFVYFFRRQADEPYPTVEMPSSERNLRTGNRYLFFLVPSEQQQTWIQNYRLDGSRTYYRSVYRGDNDNAWLGIVPFVMPTAKNPKPQQSPVIDWVKQLCAALNNPAALDKLTASGDPVLAKEAAEAKKGLQK